MISLGSSLAAQRSEVEGPDWNVLVGNMSLLIQGRRMLKGSKNAVKGYIEKIHPGKSAAEP